MASQSQLQSQLQSINMFNEYRDDPETNNIPTKLHKYLGVEKTQELQQHRKEELYVQKITEILNKISTNNFVSSINAIKELNTFSQKQIMQLINIIVDKIKIETNLINIYVRLIHEIKGIKNSDEPKYTFEQLLLSRTQNLFAKVLTFTSNESESARMEARNILKFIAEVLIVLEKPQLIIFCTEKLFDNFVNSKTNMLKTLSLLFLSIFLIKTGKYVCSISKKATILIVEIFNKFDIVTKTEEFQSRDMINALTLISEMKKIKNDEHWIVSN